MRLQEPGQGPHQLFLSERMRHHHAQQAAGRLLLAVRVRRERFPVLHQQLGSFVAALAVRRQVHGPGGALQQAHAEQAFQRQQAPADGGLGGLHLRRRAREAAGFDDAHEGLHQGQPVAAADGERVGRCCG